ncbi:unnamed protein product [Ceratitis capitata]|uniref:(Mediterranean fruit fly) hypothetical protein n=1 Tax=Ceratitis capitata TaxID=7213 RepID=A0A811URG5_CERCA|nr:unnamed protein product [Ceratitis capitata]
MAEKCHVTNNWVEALLLVLLGFRSSWRDDLKATPAEMAVFLRNDAVPAIECREKFFKININRKNANGSIDQLKSAFVAKDNQTLLGQGTQCTEYHKKSRRRVRFRFPT